jgi:hypothetical protein
MTNRRLANKDQGDPARSDRRTVLALPVADRLVLFIGIPALVVLLGLLLPPLARWALGLSIGLPLRPVFKLVGAADQPWEIAINLAIWLAVGLGIAFTAFTESARVTLTDAELRLDQGDRNRTIARADVAAVFLDGKKLVVLDSESRHLARDTPAAPAAALAEAFRAHGYPWHDADPYAALYRRWVPDTPDLPAAVNTVLAVRELVLKRKADQEARDLRDAVEKLGFVVRDEDARQYWRPPVRS